jgi:hypothetical protein
MNYPEDFSSAPLDLEIDFGDKGGIQRFRNVGEIQTWLNEEQEFWSWLNRPPANQHHGQVGNMVSLFEQTYNIRRELESNNQRWNQIRPKVTQLQERANSEGTTDSEKESIKSQIEQHTSELKGIIDHVKGQIEAVIKSEIISGRNHISRMEPTAQFVRELADSNPEEAVYALDQIILEEKKNGDRRRVEHSGRMMAALYIKNLNKKIQPDKKAFEKAIVTWSKELADFKSRYEDQEREFAEISGRHSTADESWQERSTRMAEEFAGMRERSERDLKNLTDTYEAHMQLKGPLVYWRGKRREHRDQIKKLTNWSIFTGIAGLIALVLAASLLLPDHYPAETVPWRQIGFFVLTSTFVLWIIRLMVKLLLSHIHLYADAKEREVMISTFMALVRRQESREGIGKTEISLVLAPIFKPSTTGVIKDDGGPATLGDFIGRLAGK